MKTRDFVMLILIGLSGCATNREVPGPIEPWYATANANGDPLAAVFECRIPCGDCEKTKFALALYRDKETGQPTTYSMARVYVGKGNDRIVNEGTWTITQGTSLDPQATLYQLDSHAPQEYRSFWAIGQDILFILDQTMSPRVGTASYGYVLNRIQ